MFTTCKHAHMPFLSGKTHCPSFMSFTIGQTMEPRIEYMTEKTRAR